MMLWMLAAPAAAQYGPPPPPPRELPGPASTPREAPTAASSADVLRAAACLVDRDADAGASLLRTAPFSRHEREQASRTLRQAARCLRVRDGIATTALRIRGALAESLYESQFAQPPARRDPPAAARPFFQAAAATALEDVDLLEPYYALADCTVARQPDQVRALLATDPATDAELAALQSLNPVWATCVPAGTRLTIDPEVVRGIFAETLYRWSVVQRDGAESPWAASAAADD